MTTQEQEPVIKLYRYNEKTSQHDIFVGDLNIIQRVHTKYDGKPAPLVITCELTNYATTTLLEHLDSIDYLNKHASIKNIDYRTLNMKIVGITSFDGGKLTLPCETFNLMKINLNDKYIIELHSTQEY